MNRKTLTAVEVAIVILIIVVIVALTWPTCVVEGTLVATPTGPRAVETLRVGDQVWCQAPDGTAVEGTVTAVERSRAVAHLRLTFADGETLGATSWHPLATTRGWVEAGDLRVGQVVHTRGGRQKLTAVERVQGLVTVFDLSVSPHPNFFAQGVLVHNKTYRKGGNESAAMGALKTLGSAQTLYREGDKDNNKVLDFAPNLKALGDIGLIDSVLATGTKYEYTFVVSRPEDKEARRFLWMATASPVEPGKSGDRYFVTTQEGVIYYTTTGPFSTNPKCTIPKGALAVGK